MHSLNDISDIILNFAGNNSQDRVQKFLIDADRSYNKLNIGGKIPGIIVRTIKFPAERELVFVRDDEIIGVTRNSNSLMQHASKARRYFNYFTFMICEKL